jgi:GntR family transcriptional regulator/MocR family aminotransferase
MPISRRLQLLSWANEEEGRYLIEDDYDSEYKYNGKPIPCIQGIDPNEKVIYLGAFSKSLTPAIRVSYMVLPTHLVGQYRDRLGFYLCPVPVIEQKVLCAFMGEGFFERHLNKTRKIYKEKRELLVATLRDLIPSVQILGSSAGLHVTLQIDNEMDEATLVGAAADQGVKVYGVSQYYFEDDPPQHRPTVLLGFATMRKADIADAVRSLKEAWTPLR